MDIVYFLKHFLSSCVNAYGIIDESVDTYCNWSVGHDLDHFFHAEKAGFLEVGSIFHLSSTRRLSSEIIFRKDCGRRISFSADIHTSEVTNSSMGIWDKCECELLEENHQWSCSDRHHFMSLLRFYYLSPEINLLILCWQWQMINIHQIWGFPGAQSLWTPVRFGIYRKYITFILVLPGSGSDPPNRILLKSDPIQIRELGSEYLLDPIQIRILIRILIRDFSFI